MQGPDANEDRDMRMLLAVDRKTRGHWYQQRIRRNRARNKAARAARRLNRR